MLRIHYVGPRVEISHHGIVYRNHKKDKYTYLMAALEILKAINNNYTINNLDPRVRGMNRV